MARRARRSQSGVIGTLVLELSALAGILGIAQPAVRENMWSIVNSKANANASLNSLGYPPPAMPQASPSEYPFGYSTAGTYQPAPAFTTQQFPYLQPLQQPDPLNNYTVAPGAYQAAPSNHLTAPNYTAQATLPPNPAKRPQWQASLFNPMGGYQ